MLQNLGSPDQNKHLSLQVGAPLTWPLLLLSSSVAPSPWTRGHRLWTWEAAGWNCSSPGSEGSGGAWTFPWARRLDLAATRVKGAWHQGQTSEEKVGPAGAPPVPTWRWEGDPGNPAHHPTEGQGVGGRPRRWGWPAGSGSHPTCRLGPSPADLKSREKRGWCEARGQAAGAHRPWSG